MLFNRINVNALDRIILTDKNCDLINDKLEKLKEDKNLTSKVMASDIPLATKGIVVYEITGLKKLTGSSKVAQFYYNIEHPKGLEITEVDDDGNLLYRVVMNPQTSDYETHAYDNHKKTSDSDMVELARNMALRLLDFMKYAQYMGYIKQNNPIVIKRATIKQGVQKPTDKPKKSARTVVSVSKPKKIYNYDDAERESDKRPYERQAESWEVTGHWRHYKKSGERVFVKGHKKGEGARKGKDFKV